MKSLKCIVIISLSLTLFACKGKTENTDNNANTPEVVKEDTPKKERLFKGMFSYVENTKEASFYECDKEYIISMTPLKKGDFSKLLAEYKKVTGGEVAADLYTEFKGYITDKMDSSQEVDLLKTIMITNFLSVNPEKECNY